MKKTIRTILILVFSITVVGFFGYRVWFYNPYHDILYLDPEDVFNANNSSKSLLIKNTNVIDVIAGKVIHNSHILIRGDTIAEITAGDVPDLQGEVEDYDGRGKYVMPGLFDVHVHLAMYWHLISGDFAPEDSLVTKAALEQFVRYGVTTVLVLGGGGANNEQSVSLKEMERNNEIVSPRLYAVGNQFTAPGSHPITTIMRLPEDVSPERLNLAGVTVLAEEEDPYPFITRKKVMGLDGVKIIIESGPPPFYPNPSMSIETAGSIVEAAKKYQLPVYIHTESYAEFKEAVTLDIRGVMHSVMDTLIEDDRLINRMKSKNIGYVPTLSLFYGFQYLDHPERLEDDFLQAGVSKRVIKSLGHPLFRFGFGSTIKEYDVAEWLATSMKNLVRMHKAGILIALGTDASTPFNFPGFNAHIEMELMSEAGLSNADVLRIATINSAEFLKIENEAGSIAPGKIANLIILKKNPLENIRHTRTIDKVILKGQMIDPGYHRKSN